MTITTAMQGVRTKQTKARRRRGARRTSYVRRSDEPRSNAGMRSYNALHKIKGVSCVILLGGESKRMGKDKAGVKISGKTLFSMVYEKVSPLFDEVMVSARDKNYDVARLMKKKAGTAPFRVVYDELPGRGPAIGLLSALKNARNVWVFAIGCDSPFPSPKLIRRLAKSKEGFDCVIPVHFNRLQTLFALYKKTCFAPLLSRIKKRGNPGLAEFIEKSPSIKVLYVTEKEIKKIDPAFESFMDADTPEELSLMKKKLEKGV
ncbi:MAG: molybdenum cofactor guanylyltransferase [Thermodesulfobacteriota bacterium]